MISEKAQHTTNALATPAGSLDTTMFKQITNCTTIASSRIGETRTTKVSNTNESPIIWKRQNAITFAIRRYPS
jgi:hypothetical protein